MYDIIGDIHGCYNELLGLLEKMGYTLTNGGEWVHTAGRTPVFVGDLTDRGPDSLAVIELVCRLVETKKAIYVPGNHCDKLYRFFLGRSVHVNNGLETTVAEWESKSRSEQETIRYKFKRLIEQSTYYIQLDEEQLVVSHAGISEHLIGKSGQKVRTFCLYGDITGKKDETGFPIRRDWAKAYNGKQWVVYGHTPVPEVRFINRTVNVDTGCVFGGSLSALHYPEMTTTSVKSSLPFQEDRFRHFNRSE